MSLSKRTPPKLALLQKKLDEQNADLADRTALALYGYHLEHIRPLEKRIYVIELMLGIRAAMWLFIFTGRCWAFIKRIRFYRTRAPDADEPPVGSDDLG